MAIIETFIEYIHIYTEGSKTKLGTAASFVVKYNIKKNIAYMWAFLACKYVLSQKKKAIICTSTLSCMFAIKNANCNNNTISYIRDILISNKNIKLFWIASHIDIPGNELADHAAKHDHLVIKAFFNKKDLNETANKQ